MGFLRFLLAFSVLIVHSGPILGVGTTIPGYLAVEAFYIISGYLMSVVFCEKYIHTSKPYYYFISNRFLKLFPLYWFVVLCTLLLSVVFGIALGSYGKIHYYFSYYTEGKATLESLCVVLASNLTLIGQDVITFFNVKPSGGFYFLGFQENMQLQELLFIHIAWTVAVEFMFYLVAPFIVAKSLPKVVVVILLVLLLRYVLYLFFDVNKGFIIYRFAPTEFFWFLLGVASYKLHKMGFLMKKEAAPYILLFILFLSFSYSRIGSPVIADILFYSVLFVGAGSLLERYTGVRYDKQLGDLCYPLYISHFMFLMIINANRFPKDLGIGFPLLCMTVIFSVLTNKYILEPIEVFRRNRIARH